MARYFKVIEITRNDFVDATGEDLGYCIQNVIPIDGDVFVAVDDNHEDEFEVPIDCFDEDGEG